MISDYFTFALKNVKHRQLRSWLTIIGVIIGVGAIIALITISQGLENAIVEQFEMFGADRLIIAAKGFQGPGSSSDGLTKKDVNTLESMGDFKYVTPMLSRTAEIKRKNNVAFTSLMAMPAEDYEESFGDVDVEMLNGRMIRRGDKFSVILGYRVAKDMFDDELRVNNKIKINGYDFKIVGVQEELGSSDDNQIMIPLDVAREIFNEPNKVDMIIAQAKQGSDIPALQERVERKLKRARGDENYQVLTATQILDQIGSILGIVQIVLVGIAGISLLVGGIGIMNSMYTSVLERTKEIGIMKSIGARNNSILTIFILEAGIIGVVGGGIGVALGSAIAEIVGVIAANSGFQLLKIMISYKVILFGLGFSFFIGILSGALPARKASKMNPVDALRYE